jgi:hypothetical protein
VLTGRLPNAFAPIEMVSVAVRVAKTTLAFMVLCPLIDVADANAPGAMVRTPVPREMTRFIAVVLMGIPAASNVARNNSANALAETSMEPTFTVIVGLAIFFGGYNFYKYYIL